jgi:GDPmannose 4,6-dehydratase
MKAIIFGINGQDGHYLNELLCKSNVEVTGVSRSANAWLQGDVGDRQFVENLISGERPDYIFHLAANSTTSHSAITENHATICTGTLNILKAVHKNSPETRVFLSGSAMQFENSGKPVNEQTPFSGSSGYAVARIYSAYAGRYYRKLGLKIYTGYFFNHDSPLRREQHVNQKIAQAVKRVANGTGGKIELGDVNVRKEFNFAGDVVKAVWLLVNQNDVYEAVIGCGIAHSIKEWAEYCFGTIGKDWRDYVDINKDFVPEYKVLVSDPGIIKSLGWQPEIGFEQLANLMMGEI